MTRAELEQKAREILTLAMNAGLPYSQAEDVRAKILSALVEAREGALEESRCSSCRRNIRSLCAGCADAVGEKKRENATCAEIAAKRHRLHKDHSPGRGICNTCATASAIEDEIRARWEDRALKARGER